MEHKNNDNHNDAIGKSFQLLSDVLQDAFQTQVVLFTHPYQDLSRIDMGLRSLVWTNYTDDNARIGIPTAAQPYRLYIVKSNLGFYNLLAFLSASDHPDFISVGPFRDEDLSAEYYTQIIKEAHLTPTDMMKMRNVYEQMPYAQMESILKITQHIISTFIPEFAGVEPRHIQYSEQNRSIAVNVDLLDIYTAEFSEKYRRSLHSFINYIKNGDLTNAKTSLKAYLRDTRHASTKNLREHKLLLHALNNYCHMALMDTTIHPYHILKLAASIQMKIESITTQTKLEQMMNELCRKYCLLVRNYANPEYSKLVRDTVSYIQLHLEEELSLSSLAEHFHKNPSVLSNTFSKETGTSLTKYIHQTRIHEAIKLFNTTDMSVSEVALAVGYQDFSYFSKVFSKHVGCSPKEYMRMNGRG